MASSQHAGVLSSRSFSALVAVTIAALGEGQDVGSPRYSPITTSPPLRPIRTPSWSPVSLAVSHAVSSPVPLTSQQKDALMAQLQARIRLLEEHNLRLRNHICNTVPAVLLACLAPALPDGMPGLPSSSSSLTTTTSEMASELVRKVAWEAERDELAEFEGVQHLPTRSLRDGEEVMESIEVARTEEKEEEEGGEAGPVAPAALVVAPLLPVRAAPVAPRGRKRGRGEEPSRTQAKRPCKVERSYRE